METAKSQITTKIHAGNEWAFEDNQIELMKKIINISV